MKVVFISMDTVRADRLSTLGSTRVRTPNLDKFAAESALFTHAFATDIPTQPSHTALFTGRYGVTTGIVSHFHPRAQLAEGVPWLPSLLRDGGCRTGAVDHLFAMKDWFIRGYDDYMVPPGRSRSPGSVVNGLAFPWLDAHAGDDFFLFLHYWDAHIPYVPPEPFRSAYTSRSADWIHPETWDDLRSRPSFPLFKRNLYDHLDYIPNLDYIADLHDAEIAYLDFELGRLFDHLEGLGVLDETVVVALGDHGENMTEHDAWFDHAGLYDSVVHVPLMIRAPGRVAPVRVDSMVALIDVMPTVAELVGLPGSVWAGCDGVSLLPVIRGERVEHRDVVMLSEATWQAKRGVRTRDWKFIRCYDPGIYPRAGCELYDLGADPQEQFDVSGEHPEVVAELGDRLEGWLAAGLGDRPDPLLQVIGDGLPAVARLDGVIRDDMEREANDLAVGRASLGDGDRGQDRPAVIGG